MFWHWPKAVIIFILVNQPIQLKFEYFELCFGNRFAIQFAQENYNTQLLELLIFCIKLNTQKGKTHNNTHIQLYLIWISKNVLPLWKHFEICNPESIWSFSMNVRWATPSNKVHQISIIFISIVAGFLWQTDGPDELIIIKKQWVLWQIKKIFIIGCKKGICFLGFIQKKISNSSNKIHFCFVSVHVTLYKITK